MQRAKGRDKTLRQLYRDIEKQTGVRAAALDGPLLPNAGVRMWCWFQDMSRRRECQVGMAGGVPQPIPYSEVWSYFDLTGERVDPWQRRLLTDLDDLYLTIATQEGEPGRAVVGASGMKKAIRSDDQA